MEHFADAAVNRDYQFLRRAFQLDAPVNKPYFGDTSLGFCAVKIIS